MQEELASIHETLLKTQALCFAIEGLCLALVQTHPNKALVEAEFLSHAANLEDSLLFGKAGCDEYVRNEVLLEFEKAHASIATRLKTIRSGV